MKFTKGQANKIADVVIHPYFSKNIGFIVLDGLVHFAIENNPQMSFKKFLQYNPKPLIRDATVRPWNDRMLQGGPKTKEAG